MIICPMCGNFTDNRNCEVCGIKLYNDDSEKEQQDFNAPGKYPSEMHLFHIDNQSAAFGKPPQEFG